MKLRRVIVVTLAVALLAAELSGQGSRTRALGGRNRGPGSGGALFSGANFSVDNAGWVVRAHVFPEGAVPSGQGIVVAGFDTQNYVMKTWPDGSAKHILYCANVTSTGTKTLQLGTAVAGSFSATAPSITVEATPEGGALRTATFTDTTYANARFSGPLCKETREVVSFTSSTGALAKVLVEFYLMSFSDGTHRVSIALNNSQNHVDSAFVVASVDMKIGGSSVYAKTTSVTAGSGTLTPGQFSAAFSGSHALAERDYVRAEDAGGNDWYGKVFIVLDADEVRLTNTMAVPAGSTWEKITWGIPWGSKGIKRFAASGHDEAVVSEYDYTTFHTAKAIYRPHTALIDHNYSQTMVIEVPNVGEQTYEAADFDLFNYGIYAPQISLGGQRAELTVTPEWVMEYLLYKDADQWDWMITMADRAAETGFHLTKGDGSQQKLSDNTTFYYSGSMVGGTTRGVIYSPELNGANGQAHQGGYFFVPYLMTGDWFYQQEMIAHAMFGVLNQPAYQNARGDGNGWLFGAGNGLRSGAWAATKLAECIAFLPSSESAWVSEFSTIVANNNTKEDYYIGIEPDDVTGHSIMANERLRVGNTTEIVDPPERAFLSSNVPGNEKVDQMFQQAYVVIASDHARRLGVTIFRDYAIRMETYWANFMQQVDVPKHAINAFTFYGMPSMSGSTLLKHASLQAMLDYNEANNVQFSAVRTMCDAQGEYAMFQRTIQAVGTFDDIPGSDANLATIEGYNDGGNTYTCQWDDTGKFAYGRANLAFEFASSEGYR